MSERRALLAACAGDPDDDTPRLILADWLDERGEHARAEFIRLQCTLALGSLSPTQRVETTTRSVELLSAHAADWLGPLLRESVAVHWERGLLRGIDLEPRSFERLVGECREREPLAQIRFCEAGGEPTATAAQLRALTACRRPPLHALRLTVDHSPRWRIAELAVTIDPEELRRLTLLDLTAMSTTHPDDWLQELAAFPELQALEWSVRVSQPAAQLGNIFRLLPNLRHLGISPSDQLSPPELERFSAEAERLHSLRLSVEREDVIALAQAPLPKLRSLTLYLDNTREPIEPMGAGPEEEADEPTISRDFGEDSDSARSIPPAERKATSSTSVDPFRGAVWAKNLDSLALHASPRPLSPSWWVSLFARGHFERLQSLTLSGVHLNAVRGSWALKQPRHLTKLHLVDRNSDSLWAWNEFLNSPALAGLTSLTLDLGPASAAVALTVLGDAPFLPNLVHLSLRAPGWSRFGARILSFLEGRRRPTNLTSLEIAIGDLRRSQVGAIAGGAWPNLYQLRLLTENGTHVFDELARSEVPPHLRLLSLGFKAESDSSRDWEARFARFPESVRLELWCDSHDHAREWTDPSYLTALYGSRLRLRWQRYEPLEPFAPLG